jgi:hypothetical protein
MTFEGVRDFIDIVNEGKKQCLSFPDVSTGLSAGTTHPSEHEVRRRKRA